MPRKNIVVMSDGTGQEGGEGNDTNIYKLFKMLENRTERQVVFYDRGLGTGLRKVVGKVSGFGISKNILECYQFIFEQFQAEDHIYLFGFSRGATTVRSLAGFINMFGILPKSRPELIEKAYKIYQREDSDEEIKLKSERDLIKKQGGEDNGYRTRREKDAESFINSFHTMWVRIKFLGVWDTVAALGFPTSEHLSNFLNSIPAYRHKFHELSLTESVQHCRHALAIDDERETFHPTLFDKEVYQFQTLKQVWFCGMHTDVGGGYKEQELADITLVWMVKEAQQLPIVFEDGKVLKDKDGNVKYEEGLRIFPYHKIDLKPNPNGHMHDSRGSFFARLYRQEIRNWDTEKYGLPVVHQSVVRRYKSVQNEEEPNYKPWILDGEYLVEYSEEIDFDYTCEESEGAVVLK